MKTFVRLFSILMTVSALFSCAEKEMPEVPVTGNGQDDAVSLVDMTFRVGTPDTPQVKTSLEPTGTGAVIWQKGDCLSVYDGVEGREFTTEDAGASVSFSGKAEVVDTYYALYPYDKDAVWTAGGVVTTELPAGQTALTGSFGKGANLSFAESQTQEESRFFTMKNVCSYFRFNLSECESFGITSVTLTAKGGEKLAGPVSIDWNGGNPVLTPSENAVSTVVLAPESGSMLSGEYYMVVAPGTVSGIELVFTRSSDAETATLSLNSALQFEKGKITAPNGAIDPAALPWTGQEGGDDSGDEVTGSTDVVTVNFYDETHLQPFTEDLPSSEIPVVEMMRVLKESGHRFEFNSRVQTHSNSDGKGWIIMAAGDATQHIKFPVVAGKALTKVTVVQGRSRSGLSAIWDADKTHRLADSKSWSYPSEQGSQDGVLVWDVVGAQIGQQCAMYNSSGGSMYLVVHSLELEYVGQDVPQVTNVEAAAAVNDDCSGVTVSGKVYTFHADGSVPAFGAEYRLSGSEDWTDVAGADLNADGTFEVSISDLAEGLYEVRAYANFPGEDKVYDYAVDNVKLQKPIVIDLQFVQAGEYFNYFKDFNYKASENKGAMVKRELILEDQYGGYTFVINSNNFQCGAKIILFNSFVTGKDEDGDGEPDGLKSGYDQNYLQFPGINGYCLYGVSMERARSRNGKLAIYNEAGTQQIINGDEVATNGTDDEYYTWTNLASSAGEACRLVSPLTQTSTSQTIEILNLTLTYYPAE